MLTIIFSAFLVSSVIGHKLVDLDSFVNVPKVKNLFQQNPDLSVSPYYLNYACENDFSGKNISEACVQEMEIVCNNTDLFLTMADAWSKVPYPGMLKATRRDWGAFDQCIEVEHWQNDTTIIGKQCTYGFLLPLSTEEIYLLSYCVPESCNALDVARMMITSYLPENISNVVEQLFNEQICSTRDGFGTPDGSTIAVATLFSCFAFVMVFSTIVDILLHQHLIAFQNKKVQTLLIAFSLLSNGKKLCQTTTNKSGGEQILIFHGIKVVSMMWIVAGHAAAAFSELPVTDRELVENVISQRRMQYLATAYLAVDTFFFISGFLLAYQYFKSLASKPISVQILAIPQMIVHRYLRITPVVLMFFLYSVYISKHIGNGPIFPGVYNTFNTPCKEHWWSVFLYIQNYYNPSDMCWVHLWYLSADWQLFLISPLILIPMAWQYRKRFNQVMIGMIVLNLIFVIIPICTKILFPDFDEEGLEYETHSKLVTYFMGVAFGCYLRVKRNKPYLFRNNKNLLMWCVSVLVLLAATTLYHEVNINDHSHAVKSVCQVIIKPFWCLALAFITYSCINGYGGVVNWILTAGWIQVVSKLTFCLYIMHMPVIFFWFSLRRTRQHFSDFDLFFLWCGHYLLSVIVAAIWSLSFESPLITIEKFLLGGGSGKRNTDRNTVKDIIESKNVEKPNGTISIIHKPPKDDLL